MSNELREKIRQMMPAKVLTDDIAYDDIECASEEIRDALQGIVDTYNLTDDQLLVAVKLGLNQVVPDERLYAAIDGEAQQVNEAGIEKS